MKKLLISLLACFAFSANAGPSTYSTNDNSSGILYRDVVSGFRIFSKFSSDADGNMTICQPENYTNFNSGCTNWEPISKIIPKGRTFVGMKLHALGITNQLVVFWK